jgi:hypothetical protein
MSKVIESEISEDRLRRLGHWICNNGVEEVLIRVMYVCRGLADPFTFLPDGTVMPLEPCGDTAG